MNKWHSKWMEASKVEWKIVIINDWCDIEIYSDSSQKALVNCENVLLYPVSLFFCPEFKFVWSTTINCFAFSLSLAANVLTVHLNDGVRTIYWRWMMESELYIAGEWCSPNYILQVNDAVRTIYFLQFLLVLNAVKDTKWASQ